MDSEQAVSDRAILFCVAAWTGGNVTLERVILWKENVLVLFERSERIRFQSVYAIIFNHLFILLNFVACVPNILRICFNTGGYHHLSPLPLPRLQASSNSLALRAASHLCLAVCSI